MIDTSGSMEQGEEEMDIVFTDSDLIDTLEKASQDIENALSKGLSMGGPSRNHSDQVITWTLRDIAHKLGIRYANELIDKHSLESYGWTKSETDDEKL